MITGNTDVLIKTALQNGADIFLARHTRADTKNP
jgi:hypothetical protein